MKTYKFLQIDWTGVVSVVKHSIAVGAVALLVYMQSAMTTGTFSLKEAGVVWVIGTIGAFIKKLMETYSVATPNTPVVTNTDTGSVTPSATDIQ